jgi:hypothetical protein
MANYVKAVDFASKDALLSGDPGKVIKGTEIDTEYNSIAVAISTKADLVSPALTGIPTAPTASPGTNNSQVANTAFVSAAIASGISGAGLGTIATQDANNVSISGGSITGITDLAVADGGTGSSSLTTNAVLLGNGTSAIQTVAPGTTGNVLVSNGTTWESAALPIDIQTFNESGTWTKPGSGRLARIQVWGGGGGGSRTNSSAGRAGGSGGGYSEIWLALSSLGSTETVTVGAGGAGRITSDGNGSNGGNSSFGTHCVASGGEGGQSSSRGGNGGAPVINSVAVRPQTVFTTIGWEFVPSIGDGDASYQKPGLYTQFFEGKGGFSATVFSNPITIGQTFAACGGNYVGGGGGFGSGDAGNSIYGGGGGRGSSGSGGTSVYGGAGGNSSGAAGTAPAGGGAGDGLIGGNGAAGRVVVTVF